MFFFLRCDLLSVKRFNSSPIFLKLLNLTPRFEIRLFFLWLSDPLNRTLSVC